MLYFVTPEIGNAPDLWVRLVKEAIDGGIDLLQVRDKSGDTKKIVKAIEAIQPALKKARIPLIINDLIDVAQAVKADGLHLGQSDVSVAFARAQLGEKALIGLSVETWEQARQGEAEDVDYLAASPVLPSKTKPNHVPWGLAGLKQLCETSKKPIVAIGGIRLENLQEVISCGVAAVAVISLIADAPNPRQAALDIYRKKIVGKTSNRVSCSCIFSRGIAQFG